MIEGNANDSLVKRVRGKEGYRAKANLYNFVVFKNYDGTTTGRALPRDLYNKLFPDTCNSQ